MLNPNLLMSVPYQPEGYHSVTPSLTVRDGSAAIAFYQAAFGAVEHFRLADPSGKVMHAEFQIGDSKMMISDEFPDWGSFAPELAKGALYMIYVPDADAAFAKAVGCGATPLQPPTDQFWGDRTGQVADPFGYRWTLAQKIREVSPEEIAKAAAAWTSGCDSA